MTTVRLGNSNPYMQRAVFDPETGEHIGFMGEAAPHLEQSVTTVTMQPGFDDPDTVERALSTDNDRQLNNIANTLSPPHKRYAIGVQQIEQLMDVHAGGQKPDWVASDDQAFADAVGAYYNIMPGEPKMLLTNNGRDALHAQHMSTTAPPATFNYIALTASTTAPAATDTTLAGEITTAGGGLLRAQATYAHTAGTNTSTLTRTFTANPSDALPVTVAQIGVFNAASAGTMAYHTSLSSTATLNVSGDNVTITETVTGG